MVNKKIILRNIYEGTLTALAFPVISAILIMIIIYFFEISIATVLILFLMLNIYRYGNYWINPKSTTSSKKKTSHKFRV